MPEPQPPSSQPQPAPPAQPSGAVVIRAHQRKQHTIPGNPVTYHALSPEGVASLGMFVASASPGQSTGAGLLRHGGDENLLVTSGTLEVEVEGVKHTLGPGDCVFIPRGQRHRVTNVGKEAGEAVFVLSPPDYG